MQSRLASATLVAILALLLPVGAATAQTSPEFRLGFADLAGLIPDIAGTPLEEEHHGANGDSLQRTSTGLMVWRKADNWTAFTDGTTTWINGPAGVQGRPNGERFPWEGDTVPPAPRPQPSTTPRVNLFPTGAGDRIDWSQAPIFWFGRATEHENYVDVRLGYDGEALQIFATVVDYHLWFDSPGGADPRGFDSLGILLSTGASGSPFVDRTEYLFVSGFRSWPSGNDPRWHRQARGEAGRWDPSWSPAPEWTDQPGGRWYRSGPNNNSDRDAGWATTVRIPWQALGLSGPPPAGASWRLGVQLYDRDEPLPAGLEKATSWPASAVDTDPSTWGNLSFGMEDARPAGQVAGTTVVRRGLGTARVVDAYAGGGGNCQGGVFGDGDRPHPGGEHLFVQNQSDVSDFPCFSKSYLRFDLSDVPPGKVILSATLRIYGFGGSDPTQAKPSHVQLFTVAEDWDEATLTWNNAPVALENVGVGRVDVIRQFPGWPGVPSEWDATRAVAEAYAARKPASLALYAADTAYHSGKYFISSDTGEWNAGGRPTLTIQWGEKEGEAGAAP